MAYVTKSGAKIPSQFDLIVLPLLLAFAAIGDVVSVAELRERIKALSVPVESDEFAHLRLKGTHDHLGGLIAEATRHGACAEFVDLLEKLRDGVARRHDALPVKAEFPRARLAKPAPGAVADWAAAAEKREPELAPPPVSKPADYEQFFEGL